MKLALAVLLCSAPLQDPQGALQPVSPAAVPDSIVATDAEAPPAQAPSVERYDGTFSEGAAELRRLVLEGDTDGALAVSDRLLVPGPLADLRARVERATAGVSERALARLAQPLEWFGIPADESAARAEVHYDRGLIYARRAEVAPAVESFELARVLAGPGPTRLDAVYNQGTLTLHTAEALRMMIPEIAGEDAVEPPEGMEEDPLDLARAAYLSARERFVERLRVDWRDVDTRANVELTLRRLAELDEVERQREEQQQEQDDSQENQEEDQQQDGEQQESDEQQQPEEGEQEESDASDEGEQQEPEEQESEEPSEEESEPKPSEEEPQEAQEGEEQHLTEEEVKRLLERLQQLDKKGEELRERLRGVRRVPVKRDW